MASKPARIMIIALSALAFLSLAALLSGCTRSAPGTTAAGAAPAAPSSQAQQSSTSVPAPTVKLLKPLQGAEVAAGDVAVAVETANLEFVMPSNTIVSGQGHVHFTLDDQPLEMSITPSYVFKGVAPGQHRLKAELVQNDTKSFAPPVVEEITFSVK